MYKLRAYLENVFDKVYCINLDKRIDRREKMSFLFNELWISNLVTRFRAIEFKPWNVWCAMSHAEILKEAKKLGYKKILVLEDDVEIKDMNLLSASIENYPCAVNWKLLLLWYSLLYVNWYNETQEVNDYWKIWYGLSWGMAIGYDSEVFDEIIDFIWNSPTSLKRKMWVWTWFDRWLAIVLQRRHLTLFTKHNLVYEGYTLSNITYKPVHLYPKMLVKQRICRCIFNNKVSKFLYQYIYLYLLKIYWIIRGWHEK